MKMITEFRGVTDLVFCEVLNDNNDAYETGEVKELAGVATISKTTEQSSENKYYNNKAAITIQSAGADTVTLTISALDLETLAAITGQTYDSELGVLIEGEREAGKYFAIGYRTQKTDGTEILVWRLKGSFNIPDMEHNTKNDGTDANGMELEFTGIETTHKFTKTGKSAKAINVDTSKDLVDTTDFFATVQTPDTLKAKTQAEG
jgi:phi13 family phage major tail protein